MDEEQSQFGAECEYCSEYCGLSNRIKTMKRICKICGICYGLHIGDVCPTLPSRCKIKHGGQKIIR